MVAEADAHVDELRPAQIKIPVRQIAKCPVTREARPRNSAPGAPEADDCGAGRATPSPPLIGQLTCRPRGRTVRHA